MNEEPVQPSKKPNKKRWKLPIVLISLFVVGAVLSVLAFLLELPSSCSILLIIISSGCWIVAIIFAMRPIVQPITGDLPKEQLKKNRLILWLLVAIILEAFVLTLSPSPSSLIGLFIIAIVFVIAAIIIQIRRRVRSDLTKESARKNRFAIRLLAVFFVLNAFLLITSIFFLKIPPTAEDYNHQGLEAFNKHNYNEAIINFNHSIKLDPNNAVTYELRGASYQELGQTAEAIADFQKCLSLNPYASTRQWVEAHLHQLGVTQ
jgi:hypothetical protein